MSVLFWIIAEWGILLLLFTEPTIETIVLNKSVHVNSVNVLINSFKKKKRLKQLLAKQTFFLSKMIPIRILLTFDL